jgi:SNF2 family DNA or RNA helicase
MKKFDVDISKLNIFSILERDDLICDNFYLFPGNMLQKMIEIFKLANNDKMFGHFIKKKLGEINFIRNEYTKVALLTSYKLHYLSRGKRFGLLFN